MYILDSILKNVQGRFVKHFEEKIPDIFNVAFLNARSDGERKSLIKLFNVWSLLLDPALLSRISH
jgi:hypothetical protein